MNVFTARDIRTLKILKLTQSITLIVMLFLILIYHNFGDTFKIMKTVSFAIFLFVPNIRGWVKELSYKELRNSIGMLLVMLWQFLLLDVCFSIESTYGKDLGIYVYLIISAPVTILFLCIVFSGEWRELVYPIIHRVRFMGSFFKERFYK